jgi:hypothetical protein
MELFKEIRLKIGTNNLAKKLARKTRKAYYTNIGQVKTIALIWDASRTTDFAGLSRFHQKMHERNIDVKILGYFSGKELPDQYTAIRYLTCIRKKEINLIYQPDSSEVNTFINNRFDVLIDINFNNLFPLGYITALSNAAFKVGLFESETGDTPYDLMMEIKKPVDLDNYLNQIIQYLEMINSGTVKAV